MTHYTNYTVKISHTNQKIVHDWR